MSSAAQEFLRSAALKSGDLTHRQIIRRGIDQYSAANDKGRSRFADWEAARQRCHEIKWEALNNLDRYLLEFENRVKERGGHVFWAEDSAEACRYITELAVSRGVRKMVKSKSMVAEEIHLSPALEKAGIQAIETDLGEYIVQLRNEPPYHIVTPAMHLTRKDIADLFKEKLGDVDTDDPVELVAVARRALRRDFFSAEMGISGANFLVADAGMIALTTNEGNARLCTSVPPHSRRARRHRKSNSAAPGSRAVLARARHRGHRSGDHLLQHADRRPAQARTRVDGPEEFHVVLLDNGSTRTARRRRAARRAALHPLRRLPQRVPCVSHCWRPHLWHHVSRTDRQRPHSASARNCTSSSIFPTRHPFAARAPRLAR